MPPYRTDGSSRPRRDPLSCQSCRVKKLKCDRERPCSNCQARRLPCEYQGGTHAPGCTTAIDPGEDDLKAQNVAMKARIERLEQAVFADRSPGGSPALDSAKSTLTTSTPDQGGGARCSRWSDGMRCPEWAPTVGELPKVTIHKVEHFLSDSKTLSMSNSISIPPRGTSLEYLASFEGHIFALHPILHVPRVRETMESVYADLDAGKPVDPGTVGLILAICACVGYWQVHEGFQCVTSVAAIRATAVLAQQALRAVEHARVSSQNSIEAVQASILLCFHFCHLEGFSTHIHLLHASASTMARCLGLHRIDAPGSKRPTSQAQIINQEIARRIWWHLTCTDWLFSYTGGQHEGTYSIHPQHMRVNEPRNLTTEDLSTQSDCFSRPYEEPTDMTYYLQRLKLATVCREVVDELMSPAINLDDPSQVPYDKILALDDKFCEIIDGFPKVLQLDCEEHPSVEFGDRYGPNMALSRATVNLFAHSRRCKLHLPFLTRLKTNPNYALSRQICLASARKVFKARETFRLDKTSEVFRAYFRLGGTLFHIFYAAMVLVIDLCVNQEEGNRDQQQVAMLQHTIKEMEDAKASSEIVSSFHASLMDVFKRHQVQLPITGQTNGHVNESNNTEAPETNFDTSTTNGLVVPGDPIIYGGGSFEDIWQDYLYNGASLDPQDWAALISDLEMHFD